MGGVKPKSQPRQQSIVRQGAIQLLSQIFLFASISSLLLSGGAALGDFVRPTSMTPVASSVAQVEETSVSVAGPEFIPTRFVPMPEPTATLAPTEVPTPTQTATATPEPQPDVAILAGHWSAEDPEGVSTIHDPGAVCPDGLREVDVTKPVADKLQTLMEARGYRTTLVEEFDDRLKRVAPDFAPKVFLSIHADSCVGGPDYPLATGYKIAHAEPSENPVQDDRLVSCLRDAYGRAVAPYDMKFNEHTITADMTKYHAFREIVATTPAAIIELGFLSKDRVVLTMHQDDMARGLAIGLTAFLRGERCVSSTDANPTATP